MKKWLAMLLSIVLAVQLVVPAWAADGGAEQPETVSGGYTETDPAETPTPEPTVEPTAEPTDEPTPEPTEVPVEDPAAEDEIALLEATVVASGKCGDNLTWTLYEDGTLAITGTGAMYDFYGSSSKDVPWRLDLNEIKTVQIGDGVTSIGEFAFQDCTSLTSVTIPDGVTSIGYSAFSDCSSLTSITLPASMTSIEAYAFDGCDSLASITLPASVTSIKYSVFRGCDSLKTITVAEGNPVYHSDGNCLIQTAEKKLIVGCQSSVIPTNGSVTSIGEYAFEYCKNLTSIVIPARVASIGHHAFAFCTLLKSITIPASVTSIKDGAFFRCDALSDVYYTGAEKHWANIATGSNNDSLLDADIHYIGPTVIDSGTCGDNLTWTLSVDGTLAISGTGPMYDFSSGASNAAPWYSYRDKIIETVQIGDGATSIGAYAFYDCGSLTSVTIPKGVTSIEESTFEDCINLTSVTLPEGLTSIGEDAFVSCGFTNITIPASVTSIGDYAFQSCGNLTGITIPASVTSIGFRAFSGCDSVKTISVAEGNPVYHSDGNCLIQTAEKELVVGCQNSVIPTNGSVTSIGNSAFYSCKTLTSIALPEGLTSIGEAAFGLSGLTSIAIPESVTSIGKWAFTTCRSLTSVTIPTNGSVTSIGDYAFCSCGFTSITIPASVTSIGGAAFSGCTSLTDVYYASTEADWGKITIGRNNDPLLNANIHYTGPTPVASGKCGDNLTWALYEDGTLAITGTGAMYDFSGSGSDATPWYSYWNKIETVQIGDGATSIGAYAFLNVAGNVKFTIPESVTSIGNYAFDNCGVSWITIPVSVTSIGKGAFYRCTGLWQITIPEGVTSIGDYAFEYCERLRSITIPASVVSIGRCAFGECSSVETISVAEENPVYHSDGNCLIQTAEEKLIAGCQNSVIPTNGSVTSIGDCAFRGCKNLTGIAIPEGVTSIGDDAFSYCESLTGVTIPEGVTSIGDDAFDSCKNLTSVTIPASVTSIGNSAFASCKSLTSVTIPDGITSTKSSVFIDCTSLTSVTIPASMMSIGFRTFDGCTGLTDVFYSGCSEAKWNSIAVENGNDPLKKATIHFSAHQWNDGEITTPATCTENGVKTFTCSVCKETKTEKIEKLGHAFGAVEVIKAPTCTETGVSGKRCQHEGCQVIDSETVIPATGHQWDDGKVTTPASCTENGVKTYTCSVCKETKTETIEKLGHAFGEVEVIKAPTCTETGISGKRCAHENCKVIDSETVIPATGHKWDDGKVTTEPTCTEDGVKTYTCSVCSETKTETITATGHKWDNGEITTPATCTEDGVKTYTCSVCKEIKTETLEKLGHAFGAVEVIKAPTCTETGISGKRCTHEGCDVIDSETVLPATDHQWDEGVVTREPTYTENGEKTFTCVICQTTRTETIPALTPEPDSVDLNEIAKDFDGSSIGVDVDGKTVYPDGEGNYPRLTVPEGTTMLISVSTCNLPEGVDPHTRYPVSMAVYKATNTGGATSIERISEMDDLLRYAGSSIRITGNKGIRLITGINASLKNALIGEGVAGYTLEEYGTLLCWASEVQNGSLSLSDAYARHNYAYSLANGTDPVFRYAGDVIQYTNVLVGFSNEQCVDDIAMRPYITLRDADGNTYTLYGGIVNRSIGYIAYQNRGAFTPGTNAYNYIWDIIHFVYGDAYDEDYKG